MPEDKRGPRGAIGRLREKAERFAPGAGRKHRAAASDAYEAAKVAGNSERDTPSVVEPAGDDGGAD
jgi:hypothetical protein